MSQQYPQPPYQQPPAKKPHTIRNVILGIIGAGFLLVVGIAAGAGLNTNDTTAPQAVAQVQPTTRVTVTAPPKVITKTVTKTVTPDACRRALDFADQGFTLAGQAMGYVSDAFDAIGAFDVDKINAATKKMGVANKKVGALGPKYRAARDACTSSN